MNLPVAFPSWLPPWAPLVLIVAGLLYGLLLLLMPFSVFGVKSRLDRIEARLDEVQGEIRSLVLRLPASGYDDETGRPLIRPGADLDAERRDDPGHDGPPIPPGRERQRYAVDTGGAGPEHDLYVQPPTPRVPLRPPPIPVDPRRRPSTGRAEPRLEWRD